MAIRVDPADPLNPPLVDEPPGVPLREVVTFAVPASIAYFLGEHSDAFSTSGFASSETPIYIALFAAAYLAGTDLRDLMGIRKVWRRTRAGVAGAAAGLAGGIATADGFTGGLASGGAVLGEPISVLTIAGFGTVGAVSGALLTRGEEHYCGGRNPKEQWVCGRCRHIIDKTRSLPDRWDIQDAFEYVGLSAHRWDVVKVAAFLQYVRIYDPAQGDGRARALIDPTSLKAIATNQGVVDEFEADWTRFEELNDIRRIPLAKTGPILLEWAEWLRVNASQRNSLM